MADQTCPPIPAGGVDLSALHEAAIEGKDLEQVIAEQNAPPPSPPEPKPETKAGKPPQATTPPADPPA